MGSIRQGRFKSVREERDELLYKLPSKLGMGGAPVILIDKNKKMCIVGIHKGEYNKHEGDHK
jgi:hypothetical protein